MAGIGFTLQKLFKDDYASLRVRAYAYASFIAAGPWLISVGSVALIQFLVKRLAGMDNLDAQLFVVTVSYCFIFSQIISGGWQLIVTRYLADHFYQNRLEIVTPTFAGISRLVFASSLIAAVWFYWGTPLPFLYKMISTVLFLVIGQIWLAMVFLSAAKNYQIISYAFLTGGTVAVASVLWLLYRPLPFETHSLATNLLLGFTAGLTLTMVILVAVLLRTFPASKPSNPYGFLHYVDKFPALLLTGFFYNVGVWLDNIIIWFGPAGVTVEETFRYSPIYDNAVFLAYLTVIPCLVLFVVSVETEFYDRYRKFYGYIVNGGTLDMIMTAKRRMVEVLWRELYRMTKVQGCISLFFILIGGFLIVYLHFDKLTADIFRVYTLGAMASTLMLILMLIMLYFEDRKGALITSALFLILNLLLSLAVLPAGLDYYGFNYFLASMAGFCYAGLRLLRFLHRIEVHTFVSQGILEKEIHGPFTRLGEMASRYL
jgi:polysaccharide biosynthesis protein PelG